MQYIYFCFHWTESVYTTFRKLRLPQSSDEVFTVRTRDVITILGTERSIGYRTGQSIKARKSFTGSNPVLD